MKIMVTGGAGFIGSALLRHIIHNTNDIVINVDKLTYAGNLESLSSITDSDRYHFEQVDICDYSELTRIFNLHRPHAVYAFGCRISRRSLDRRSSSVLLKLILLAPTTC